MHNGFILNFHDIVFLRLFCPFHLRRVAGM